MAERTESNGLPKLPDSFRPTPEFQLVMACSWIAPPPLKQLQIDQIASLCNRAIDWDSFLSLTRYHEVEGLVYAALLQQRQLRIPDSVSNTLKTWKIQISMRSLLHATELTRLITRFEADDIELVPLKGVALSLQLYGEPGTRNSSDLDILIRPDKIEQASRLLEADGFRSGLHGTPLTPKQKSHIRNNLYHLEFCNTEKGLTIELHWNLGSLWQLGQMENLWKNVTHLTWMETRITTLDDDALLLFLCDHGSRHRFCCLKWLSDVARILSSERPQGWAKVIELSAGLDLKRTLAHTALLAHWIYAVPLAEEFQILIRTENYAVMMSRKVFELLVKSAASKASLGKRLGSLRLAWQVLRLRSSLPILKTLKPSLIAVGDFHDFPLSDRLFWLYYPLRPMSWLWHYFLKK